MTHLGLSDYTDSLFGGEDELLRQMRLEAEQAGVPAIQVPTDMGRLLTLLMRCTGASHALEIGTLFGYSGTLIARALPETGTLTTLEASHKHADIARENFQTAGVEHKIQLVEGPALETLTQLQGRVFDLIFIDADKENYPGYLDWALRLAKPGTLIVADNVWRNGAVVDPDESNSAATAMAEFNKKVAGERRLLSTIIGTRDCADAATVSLVIA